MPLCVRFGCVFILKEQKSTLEPLQTDGYVNSLQKQTELVDQNISTQLDDPLNKAEFKGTAKQNMVGFFLSLSLPQPPGPPYSCFNEPSAYYWNWIVKEGI